MEWFFLTLFASLTALAAAALMLFLLRGWLLDRMTDRTMVRLLKDHYGQNLWDLIIGLTRVPPHLLMELELRAETGKLLNRPLGSVVRLPDLSGVMFNPAQLVRSPLGPQEPIDLSTVIGPRSRRPLRLEMPLLISAMGFGVAMSKSFVLGVAQGASRVGVAYNAGSGPVLDEVLQDSKHLILQYAGGSWNRDDQVLAQADMLEIRYGHGGRAATGRVISAADLPAEARELMGIAEDGQGVVEAPLPGGANPAQLKELVPRLRNLIDGGPVGVKLAATHDLERELAVLLDAGIDVIALDGAQGGTHGSPPILADDFGIPTVHALHRAVQFLERTGARHEVSLIISGGLRTPGEFLKALALGADAVYVGTAAMMAATHAQLSKAVPFEPITALVWATGSRAEQYDAAEGGRTVANFLTACAEEMAEAARALGKRSIRAIDRSDLLARDLETARSLGLSGSWRSSAQGSGIGGQGPAGVAPPPVPPWNPPPEALRRRR